MAIVRADNRMLADAEGTFRAGIAYCDERDLNTWTLYMMACLAGVLVEQGRVDEPARLAAGVLRHPHLPAVSRIPALLATTTIAVCKGDPRAVTQLSELDGLADGSTQAQYRLPVALLRAEAAWTAGRGAEIVTLTQQEWSVDHGAWEPWILAELAWWRRRGGAGEPIAFELPEPFALMRDGRASEASDAWTAIGRPFWAALALTSGNPADAAEAVATLLRLDAPASAHAVQRDLAHRGLPYRADPEPQPEPTPPASPAARSTSFGSWSKACPTPRSPPDSPCPNAPSPTTSPPSSANSAYRPGHEPPQPPRPSSQRCRQPRHK